MAVTHTFAGTSEGVKFVKQVQTEVATAEVDESTRLAKTGDNYVILNTESLQAVAVPTELLNKNHPAVQELNS